MKTVGILTFHISNNYGTILQCYALKKIVERSGEYHVIIIPHALVTKIENDLNGENLHRQYDKRIAAFDDFLKNIIGCKDECIPIVTKDNFPKCDYYIVGSDTIWNTVFTRGDKNYFLDFADDSSVKIAYAPSLGVSDTSKLERKIFEEYIPKFDYLSVREKENVDYLKQFTDKDIEPVLDPTLLLEEKDYAPLEKFQRTEKYILLYIVYDYSESVSYMVNMANRIAIEKGLQVIHFIYNMPEYVLDQGKSFAFATLEEFLGYVKNAELVLTNSFHGTAFSIIYRKPFYSYPSKGRDTKITNLLQELHLEDRILRPTLELQDIRFDINYCEAEKRLELKRQSSLEFLRKALGTEE